MSCCSSLFYRKSVKTNNTSFVQDEEQENEQSFTSDRRQKENDYYDALEVEKFYDNRPKRGGIFFLCHKSFVKDVQLIAHDYIVGEPLSIWDEFFSCHPVRHELCKEFMSINFKPEFVNKHPSMIRMASYRWLNVQGVGQSGKSYKAPSNYIWFLQWIKEHKFLGWMDFMANIVVNVTTEETVSYMGAFFAQLETIAEWMLSQKELELSLGRAWIYQETAFGAFDSSGIDLVLNELRDLGLEIINQNITLANPESKFEQCKIFCKKAEHMAKLLDRRGYFAFAAEHPLLKERQYAYYLGPPHNDMSLNVTDLLISRTFLSQDEIDLDEDIWTNFVNEIHTIICEGYRKGYTAMYHLCDFFTAPENDDGFEECREAMKKLCTKQSWKHSNSKEDFFEQIGDPLLAAYSALQVSYETDRESSVTKVAIAIMGNDYNYALDYDAFCEKIWVGAADLCLKTSHKKDSGYGFVRTSQITFQQSIPRGKRFLGGIIVSGARFCGNGSYRDSDGNTCTLDWIPLLVTNYTFRFQYDFDTKLWKHQKQNNNNDTNDDGQSPAEYFDIYLTNGPIGTNYFCGIVCVRRMDIIDDKNEMRDARHFDERIAEKETENGNDQMEDVVLGGTSKFAEQDRQDREIIPTYAWFYTSRDVPDYPKPMEEAIFC